MDISVDMPCPCDSGENVAACGCFREGRWLPPAADVAPPGTQTNQSHPDCYMSALNDCSDTISREHYLSEAILERLYSGEMFASGFPWQVEPQKLPPNAFASKILCIRHNSALSPLDARMLRFYLRLCKAPVDLVAGTDGLSVFNGHDIERWMLKVLCGICVSDNASFGATRIRGWTPPLTWIEILVGRSPMPSTWGLYSANKLNERFQTRDRIDFAPVISNFDQSVQGARMALNGLAFILALADVRQREGLLIDAYYRPSEIIYGQGSPRVVLALGWEQSGDGVSISLSKIAP